MKKDIYTYLKEMVKCTYESDLKDHKREVFVLLSNLSCWDYSRKEVEDVVRYVFGNTYLNDENIRNLLKRFN